MTTQERWAALGLLIWLLLLGLGSAFVSLPLRPESAGAYLQGLLIGMAGLMALVAAGTFGASHAVIRWPALGAAALGGLAGIFGIAWLGVAGSLLAALALATLGARLLSLAAQRHRIQEWTAALAALAATGATLMGACADWITAVGARPAAGYAALAGLSVPQWLNGLQTGFTHALAASVVALAVATACTAGTGAGNRLMRFGLWVTALGTVLVGVIYLAGGFSLAQPPILLQGGPGGLNGLWSGELSIGIGVLLGGTIALAGLDLRELPAVVVTALLLVLLTGFGSYIQLHENLYGMGALAAPRAAADAAFTWLRADFGWLLLPAVLTALVALRPLGVAAGRARLAAGALVTGSVVAFLGAISYIFIQPAPMGASFVIAAVGLAAIVTGVLIAIRAALVTA